VGEVAIYNVALSGTTLTDAKDTSCRSGWGSVAAAIAP
jgi:hypothetical protein